MKIVIYCCFLLSIVGCKSQEPSKEINTPVITDTESKKPRYLGESQTMDPNTVLIQAKELSFTTSKTSLCDNGYEYTIDVQVEQIENLGSSLINAPAKDQVLTLGIPKILGERYQLKRTKGNSSIIKLKLKEKPCPDMTTTIYEMISFELQ